MMSIFTMKMIFGIRRYQQIKEKQIVDASICREASSSAIERKARCNHWSASIFKCPKKKNKIQLLIRDHLQNMENTKLRMCLFIVDRNKASAYELTM